MSKKVKINPAYNCQGEVMNVWGVQFVKQEDDTYVGEVSEKLAKEMIDNKRAALVKAVKTPSKTTDKPNFASDEAGELHAKLVADKKLTKAEFKKIEGSDADEAITVGDIEDYVASKIPPAPKAVKG